MDVKYINPFLKAFDSVMNSFGATEVKKSAIKLKKDMTIEKDITTFIGIVGSIRGNISYSYDMKTAKEIISLMMGMEIEKFDNLARSAIGELSNMITGNALALLAENGEVLDVTTPTVVMGKNMYFLLGSIDTIMVILDTKFGEVEIDFGFEI